MMNNFATIFFNRFSLLVKAVLVISIGGLLNLTACRAMDNPNLAALEDKQWTLEEIDEQQALGKSSGDGMGELGKPYLKFDFSKNHFSGMASCNLISGQVQVTGNQIKFKVETITAMACREPLMQQEHGFVEFLGKITRFERSEHHLTLYAEDWPVLKFTGTKKDLSPKNHKNYRLPAEIKLETVKWSLTAIEGKSLPAIETELFINFDPGSWSVSGSTGCNSFGGGYKTGTDRVNIDAYDPLQKLPIRCTPDLLAIQIKFLESLPRVSRFEIKDGKLNLFDDKDKLLLSFEGREKSSK